MKSIRAVVGSAAATRLATAPTFSSGRKGRGGRHAGRGRASHHSANRLHSGRASSNSALGAGTDPAARRRARGGEGRAGGAGRGGREARGRRGDSEKGAGARRAAARGAPTESSRGAASRV